MSIPQNELENKITTLLSNVNGIATYTIIKYLKCAHDQNYKLSIPCLNIVFDSVATYCDRSRHARPGPQLVKCLQYYTPTNYCVMKTFKHPRFDRLYKILYDRGIKFIFSETDFNKIMNNRKTNKYLKKMVIIPDLTTFNPIYFKVGSKEFIDNFTKKIKETNFTEFTQEHLEMACENYPLCKEVIQIILNKTDLTYNSTCIKSCLNNGSHELIDEIITTIGTTEDILIILYDSVKASIIEIANKHLTNHQPLTTKLLQAVCKTYPNDSINLFTQSNNIPLDDICILNIFKYGDGTNFSATHKIIPTKELFINLPISKQKQYINNFLANGFIIDDDIFNVIIKHKISTDVNYLTDRQHFLMYGTNNTARKKKSLNNIKAEDIITLLHTMCSNAKTPAIQKYVKKFNLKYDITCLQNAIRDRKLSLSNNFFNTIVNDINPNNITREFMEEVFTKHLSKKHEHQKLFNPDYTINYPFRKYMRRYGAAANVKSLVDAYHYNIAYKTIQQANGYVDTVQPVTTTTTTTITEPSRRHQHQPSHQLSQTTTPLPNTRLNESTTIPLLYATYFKIKNTTNISFINLRFDFIKRLTKNKWNKNNQITIPKALSTHLTIPNNQTTIRITDLDNLLYLFYQTT